MWHFFIHNCFKIAFLGCLFQMITAVVTAEFLFPFEAARIKRTPELKTFSFVEGRLSFSFFPAVEGKNRKLQLRFVGAEKESVTQTEGLIVCLFDVSSSMQEYAGWDTLLSFVQELVDYKKNGTGIDFIFYADTAHTFSLQQAQEKEKLQSYLKNLSAQGGTNLELAFEALGLSMERYGAGVVKKVILFSDGRPTLGRVDFAHFKEVAQILQANYIELDVFYTGDQKNPAPLLTELVKNTGGSFYNFFEAPRQLLTEIQEPLISRGRLQLSFPGQAEKTFFIPVNSRIWTENILLEGPKNQKPAFLFEFHIPQEGSYKGECEF